MPKPLCAKTPDKRWFASEREARAHALWIEWELGNRLRAYECPDCGGWHLTTKAA